MRKKLLVFGLTALVVLAVLLPTIYSITARNTSTRGGRVFKYTVIMNTQKDPPDDPWGSSDAALLLTRSDSSYLGFTTEFQPSTTRSTTVTGSLHGAYPMLSTVRVIHSFSFTSTTTTVVSWRVTGCAGSCTLGNAMMIPSRTYSAGVTYRWVITFNMYDTPTLKVMPIIPVSWGSGISRDFVHAVPMTAVCTYISPTQGSGAVSLSTSRSYINSTHMQIIYSLTIPSGWDNRVVSECTVYTTHSTIINSINSFFGTNINQLWLLYVAPSVTVYAGDMIVVEVYVVAPANV